MNAKKRRRRGLRIYQRLFKRPLDFFLALIGVVTLSPVMALTAGLVKIFLGGPVIFKQERPGLGGKIFTMYKFRSMNNKKDKHGNLLPDEVRLTKFGRLLRSTSLDELPELFNILAGDMSIVGPRPLLVSYLPLYNHVQRHRHDVRPGLTGLAQVNGRNAITWQKKFQWDIRYVKNITFLGDLKIIFKTIERVIKRDSINSAASATMEPFTGN